MSNRALVKHRGLGLGLDALARSLTQAQAKVAEPAPPGKERRRIIGGTDAAAILGVSPYRTPLDVYLDKTGERPPEGFRYDPARERLFRRGKRAEPHGIDMLIEDYGFNVTKRSTEQNKNYVTDPEHDFLAAEIDFEWQPSDDDVRRYELPEEVAGAVENGEIKSIYRFNDEFGEAETDQIPIAFAAQAMHGLMVSGRKVALFGVLAGWDDITLYFVRRDEETIASMRRICVDFWMNNVLARVPPAPRTMEDLKNVYRRMGQTLVPATPELEALIDRYAKLRRLEKRVARLVEQTQFEIGVRTLGRNPVVDHDEPGCHTVMRGNTPLLSVDFQQSFTVNDTKLKAKYPAVAEDCVRLNQFFVYRLPRATKPKLSKLKEIK